MPPLNGTSANSCVSLNDYIWETSRDPTTLPAVWALFGFFYFIIIVLGVCGNLCVVVSIGRTRSLQTVPNLFIFCLSCSDIMVCLTSGGITYTTAMLKVWVFGSFLCSVAPFLAGTSLSVSTFILAAISIDRYILIRFPMKKPFSHGQAFIVIIIVVILAMGLSGPSAIFHRQQKIPPYCGEYCFENWGTWQNERRAYGSVLLSVQFIIPLGIIIFCYTSIALRLGNSLILKKGKKRDYGWQSAMSDQQRAASKRRQRTNRMFIAMVFAFTLSWCWNILFNVLADYKSLPRLIQANHYVVGISTHCIAMTSTIWNPLLYALLNLQLRTAFIDLMPRCIRKCLIKNEDAYANGPRAHHRNVPSSMLLTAESRAFDRSGASSPIPPSRNGWLTPGGFQTGPRNSFAFPSPIEETNGGLGQQLIQTPLSHKTRKPKWIRELVQRKKRPKSTTRPTEPPEISLDSLSGGRTLSTLRAVPASNGTAARLPTHHAALDLNANNAAVLIVPSIQIEAPAEEPPASSRKNEEDGA